MTSQAENEPLGVMFLMDGLNFNQGDGEATLEDLDVAALSHAEVLAEQSIKPMQPLSM